MGNAIDGVAQARATRRAVRFSSYRLAMAFEVAWSKKFNDSKDG